MNPYPILKLKSKRPVRWNPSSGVMISRKLSRSSASEVGIYNFYLVVAVLWVNFDLIIDMVCTIWYFISDINFTLLYTVYILPGNSVLHVLGSSSSLRSLVILSCAADALFPDPDLADDWTCVGFLSENMFSIANIAFKTWFRFPVRLF